LVLITFQPDSLYGGNSIKEAARIFTDVLEGKGTAAQNNVVIANSAVGLNLVFPEKSLLECVQMATDSLNKGKALQKLKAVTA
jgi:anthranilate phosphoribosyltransferase